MLIKLNKLKHDLQFLIIELQIKFQINSSKYNDGRKYKVWTTKFGQNDWHTETKTITPTSLPRFSLVGDYNNASQSEYRSRSPFRYNVCPIWRFITMQIFHKVSIMFSVNIRGFCLVYLFFFFFFCNLRK